MDVAKQVLLKLLTSEGKPRCESIKLSGNSRVFLLWIRSSDLVFSEGFSLSYVLQELHSDLGMFCRGFNEVSFWRPQKIKHPAIGPQRIHLELLRIFFCKGRQKKFILVASLKKKTKLQEKT